jgi:limonene 1,2-monooxygenase
VQSPSGMQAAGEYGTGVLTMSVPRGQTAAALAGFWDVATDAADRTGHVMDRNEWRLVLHVHLADSRADAVKQIQRRAGRYRLEYSEGTTGSAQPLGLNVDEVAAHFAGTGDWCIGTPDDLIEKIEALQGHTGGFGGLMVQAVDWADTEHLYHSYELLARYVMPHFQGSVAGLKASQHDASLITADLRQIRVAQVERAKADYEASKQATPAS